MVCFKTNIFFSSLTVSLSKTFFVHMKISYYCFNRNELLQKAKNRYHNCGGREKSAKYFIDNKEAFTENSNKYRNLSE